MSVTEQVFIPPALRIGDQVYWYADALHPSSPALGWVVGGIGDPNREPESRPKTVTLLVVQADGSFVMRQSVRHKDDPGLIENATWRQWGCYEISKPAADMARIVSLLPGLTSLLAKSAPKLGKE